VKEVEGKGTVFMTKQFLKEQFMFDHYQYSHIEGIMDMTWKSFNQQCIFHIC
jgi:hypothetical protein